MFNVCSGHIDYFPERGQCFLQVQKQNLSHCFHTLQKIRCAHMKIHTCWPLAASFVLCTFSAIVHTNIFIISPMFRFRQSICFLHTSVNTITIKASSTHIQECVSEWPQRCVKRRKCVCVCVSICGCIKRVCALLLSSEVTKRHFSKGLDKVIFHSGALSLFSVNSSPPRYIKQKGYC